MLRAALPVALFSLVAWAAIVAGDPAPPAPVHLLLATGAVGAVGAVVARDARRHGDH